MAITGVNTIHKADIHVNTDLFLCQKALSRCSTGKKIIPNIFLSQGPNWTIYGFQTTASGIPKDTLNKAAVHAEEFRGGFSNPEARETGGEGVTHRVEANRFDGCSGFWGPNPGDFLHFLLSQAGRGQKFALGQHEVGQGKEDFEFGEVLA